VALLASIPDANQLGWTALDVDESPSLAHVIFSFVTFDGLCPREWIGIDHPT
jgi:hypothetical protein